MVSELIISGAREHNLKNVSLTLPRDKLIVITGLSGSGKSTLAFDTIYAEGQRRYVESLSSYARQFLGMMNKPDVDSIEGLSPAISIEQHNSSHNPRSTVGTTTEIYDHLRLLFARIGDLYCPECGKRIQGQTPDAMTERIMQMHGTVTILAPIVSQKKGTYEKLFEDLRKEGFARVRVNGNIKKTDEKIKLARYNKHDIDIVIDRLSEKDRARVQDAVELALSKASGLLKVLCEDGSEMLLSRSAACTECGIDFEELQPRMFSFNSPFGACEDCKGLGFKQEFDPELIIPDKSLSIIDGAIAAWSNVMDSWRYSQVENVAKHFKVNLIKPIAELPESFYDILMYGTDEQIRFKYSSANSSWSNVSNFEGLIPQMERLYKQTESEWRRTEMEKFMRTLPCPTCKGKRLKKKILSVKISGKSIIDVTDMSVRECLRFFEGLSLSETQMTIACQVLKEIRARLGFLNDVGLGYLTMSRAAKTLSGGEAQRIRLATQIGSKLMGVMYILDEPSIGLHQRDNQRLIDTLHSLRDIGNTLLVVEHDEATIRSADHVVDVGPGAGIHGGRIVAQGTPEEIAAHPESLTGKYLSGALAIEVPQVRRKAGGGIHIIGARENNLKGIDVTIPTRVMTAVTGVSGSGKSTLVNQILHKAMMRKLHGSSEMPGKHDKVVIDDDVDKVIVIDQSPIGKTPRSNPATYIKVFDDIRQLFALTQEAKMRGYGPGRFSFNVKGGRCEHCSGDGLIKIEMNFLPDVYIECEECKGQRYNKETLAVTYKGKSIAQVLNMSVEEACSFFENIPGIKRKLEVLNEVGLGYVKLGQSSTTLSGGEAQRIKLTRELAKRGTGNTLYILDEPTTGLHFDDVKRLLTVMSKLVDRKNTMVVIEHNLDVIKTADHVIDLGPEGGDEGGRIVAQGTPEEVAQVRGSYTGQFLKGLL